MGLIGRYTGAPRVASRALLAALLASWPAVSSCAAGRQSSTDQPLARVIVADQLGARVPLDFDGISIEYPAVPAYLGETPGRPNAVFRRLIENLGRGSLRVGGDSQDTSCWSAASGIQRPGCAFTITPTLLRLLFSTAAVTHWRAIVGLNLAADDPTAARRYVVDGILPAARRGTLLGLELGNEPDEYANHDLRPAGYTLQRYVPQLDRYIDVFTHGRRLRALPLVGPAFVTAAWDAQLARFLAAPGAGRLNVITLHQYPFSACTAHSAARASLGALLSESTMAHMAHQFAPLVAVARSHGRPAQMDEMNSVSCHGKAGVSDTFASALWGLDTLFTLARLGFARANFHIYDVRGSPGYYNPVVATAGRTRGGTWTYAVQVRPLYYAMLLFAQAAGHRFMPTTIARARANIKAYAVGDTGVARVFLLNKDLRAGDDVALVCPGARGPAVVTMLRASSPAATGGTRLGGQAISMRTGILPMPATMTVRPDHGDGVYRIPLPVASAAMVSFRLR